MPLIRFSIQNPLVVNLLLGLVVIAGVLSWQAMPQEMFPVVELDRVRITTIFEGASPEEVERQITLPIEEAVRSVHGVERVTSTSRAARLAICGLRAMTAATCSPRSSGPDSASTPTSRTSPSTKG